MLSSAGVEVVPWFLAKFAKLWAEGSLPQEYAPWLCGASLTPLRKPDGGVRPIAVGECLRRLAAKCILATGNAKAQVEALRPLQVGVGTPGAAESVAMAVSFLVKMHIGTATWVLLKVDLKNAFNCTDRLAMLRNCTKLTPALYNYLRFCYSQAVPAYVGKTIIECQRGTKQGYPLGPTGFAISIHPELAPIWRRTESPGHLGIGMMGRFFDQLRP